MKNIIVNYGMNKIRKENKYDEIFLEEVKYGLEAIYLNVSKLLVYFIINALLGNFLNGLLFLLFYIPLRSFSYGFHAKNSITCWILSGITFIVLPYVANLLNMNLTIKIILIVISFVIYLLYSPADTPSRPIINKKRRFKLKVFTLITVIIYSSLILLVDKNLTNLMIIALVYQSIMISPFFYKIFGLEYNNYLNYGLN